MKFTASPKILLPVLVCATLLSAAALRAQEATPAPAQPKSIAPKSHLMPAWRESMYACDDGAKVVIQLRGQSARVTFQDHVYAMKRVESADGTKFSNGTIAWWSKGTEGSLNDETSPDKTIALAKNCHLQSQRMGHVATLVVDTVSGTVAYLQRIAMPPDAVVEVKLEDVSLADAPAVTIAEEKITFGERQVPIPFQLKFDPAKIDPKHTYAVRAKILVNSELRFTTDKAYYVLTQGNPSKADLILVMTSSAPKR